MPSDSPSGASSARRPKLPGDEPEDLKTIARCIVATRPEAVRTVGNKLKAIRNFMGILFTAKIDGHANEHQRTENLALNPAGQIPVIVDNDAPSGRLVLTQAPAILIYLAEKSGKCLPRNSSARAKCLEWLMFQAMDVSGPMAQRAFLQRRGNAKFAPAMSELKERALKFYHVLDDRLGVARFLGGDAFSIADIMAFPTADSFEHQEFSQLRNVARWLSDIASREPVFVAIERLEKLHRKQ